MVLFWLVGLAGNTVGLSTKVSQWDLWMSKNSKLPKYPTLISSNWLNNILIFGVVVATLDLLMQIGVNVTSLLPSLSPSSSLASLCWCATSVLASKISALTLVLIVYEPSRRATILPLPLLRVYMRLLEELRVSTTLVVTLYWCWGKRRQNWRSFFFDKYGGLCLRCQYRIWIGRRWVFRVYNWVFPTLSWQSCHVTLWVVYRVLLG